MNPRRAYMYEDPKIVDYGDLVELTAGTEPEGEKDGGNENHFHAAT
jgi:hypothetical protein